MPEHPLTDEKCDQITDKLNIFSIEDAMRDAADWQLEQVMKWLAEELTNYTDNDYLGNCLPFYMLESDLKQAMRPQEDNS